MTLRNAIEHPELRSSRLRLAALFTASALGGCANVRTRGVAPVDEAPAANDVPLPPGPVVTPPAAAPTRPPRPSRRIAAPAPRPASAAPEPRQPSAREDRRAALRRRVEAHVAARMRGDEPAVHRAVAGAVVAEADEAGIDPALVLAVIHVESSFDPDARSRAGAMGLMQIRRSALREELGRRRARTADAYDPQTNVHVGVRYLRRLLDSFGGVERALMAYNAGPARMRVFLARGRIPASIRAYPRKVKLELARLDGIAGGDGRLALATAESRESPERAAPAGSASSRRGE